MKERTNNYRQKIGMEWNGKIKCMYYVRCVCVNVVPCRSIQVWGLSSIQQITSFNLSSLLGFHAGDCRRARGIGHHHIIVGEALASFTFFSLRLSSSLSLSFSLALKHIPPFSVSLLVFVWECVCLSHTQNWLKFKFTPHHQRKPTLAKCAESKWTLMVLLFLLPFIQLPNI